MHSDTAERKVERGRFARFSQALILFIALSFGAGAFVLLSKPRSESTGNGVAQATKPTKRPASNTFRPTPAQWASLTIEAVEERPFRSEIVTDGKISINEDTSTPVFSPYAGIVKRLAVHPGDVIKPGQLVFSLEATDMVPAQNDFITPNATLDTVKWQKNLAEITEKRQPGLFEAKATPLKDWQQSQADLVGAQSNVRSAEIALEAVRNRLRILKKTEEEIAEFQRTGKINPD